jgi:hypothetical protein
LKASSDNAGIGSLQVYDCSYHTKGKTAKFRLQFKQNRPFAGDIPIAVGEGRFLPVAGSDNSDLLEALKTVLEAKRVPLHSPRTQDLAFSIVILGDKQNRTATGFSSDPPGDWIAAKISLPKGGDEGEVFLNLNPVLGKGEFSIKDADYGDYVLKKLAKIL